MTHSGSVSDFRRYKDAVHKYEQNHLNRRPRFVTVRYDLLTDWKPDITIPCAADKGVYAFFNKQEDLLYVGKASHSDSLGKRICSYFHAETDDQGARPRHPWTANGRPRYVLITATYHAFEAPSLEEYLIQELQPPENSVGRKRSP